MANQTLTGWVSLPNEVHLMIMAAIPDVTSLYNLLCAAKVSRPLFASFFNHVFSDLVANSMPRDLQEMVYLVIAIEDHTPFKDILLTDVLYSSIVFDEEKDHLQLLKPPKTPFQALHRIVRIVNAVGFFTALFPKLMACRHSNFKDRVLTNDEFLRLHRGLWRFEVCCA